MKNSKIRLNKNPNLEKYIYIYKIHRHFSKYTWWVDGHGELGPTIWLNKMCPKSPSLTYCDFYVAL
jgi:hypothetical protein